MTAEAVASEIEVSRPIPDWLKQESVRVKKLSTDQLWIEVKDGRALAARLGRLALCIRELEERGENLDGVKSGMLHELRCVAYGQLLPELVVKCLGNRPVLRKMAALPLPDQEAYADDKSVMVVDPGQGGPEGRGPTHRMVPPSKLTPAEVGQVFGPKGIRTEAEQVAYLVERGERTRKPSDSRAIVEVSKRRQVLVIHGPTEIPAKRLTEYIREMLEK